MGYLDEQKKALKKSNAPILDNKPKDNKEGEVNRYNLPKLSELGLYTVPKTNKMGATYDNLSIPISITRVNSVFRDLTGVVVKVISIDENEVLVDLDSKKYSIKSRDLPTEFILDLHKDSYFFLQGVISNNVIYDIRKQSLKIVESKPKINYSNLDIMLSNVDVWYGTLYCKPIIVKTLLVPNNAKYVKTKERIYKDKELKVLGAYKFWGETKIPLIEEYIKDLDLPYNYIIEASETDVKLTSLKNRLEGAKKGRQGILRNLNEAKLGLESAEKGSKEYKELENLKNWAEKLLPEKDAEIANMEANLKNFEVDSHIEETARICYKAFIPVLTCDAEEVLTEKNEIELVYKDTLVLFEVEISGKLIQSFRDPSTNILTGSMNYEEAELEILDLLIGLVDREDMIGKPVKIYKSLWKNNTNIIGFSTPSSMELLKYKRYFEAQLKGLNLKTKALEPITLSSDQLETIVVKEVIVPFAKYDGETADSKIKKMAIKKYFDYFSVLNEDLNQEAPTKSQINIKEIDSFESEPKVSKSKKKEEPIIEDISDIFSMEDEESPF